MHEYEAKCSLNAIFSDFDWFHQFVFAYSKQKPNQSTFNNVGKKLINIIEVQIKSETIL